MYFENVVIGGGLGGLISAILLAKKQKLVLLIEKKSYPFHRVCGEYISNEVKDFLIREDLYPHELSPAEINTFELTSVGGQKARMELDLGGFGISRYSLDLWLYQKAKTIGVEFMLQTQVEDLSYKESTDRFSLNINNGSTIEAKNVIGAFGKRSKIDKALDREFMSRRSPYIGVKYHIHSDFDPNTVALHNFEGGYCGINKVEDGRFNLCYLGSREQLRQFGNIAEMEQQVLFQNPHLKKIFLNSTFLFDKPEVINEINFSPKKPVEDHVLMVGDAAGLITPLCGNGMAIAIHSGKLAAEAILQHNKRASIEKEYAKAWNKHFRSRLWIGRKVQWLFGAKGVSSFSVNLMRKSPFIANQIMKRTHGNTF